jgi:hypothetical protein
MKMAKVGFTRFKGYAKSGAMLYIPEKVFQDKEWPFVEGEVVKVRIEDGRVIQEKAEWWELIDWTKVPKDAYHKLPPEIKSKVKLENNE